MSAKEKNIIHLKLDPNNALTLSKEAQERVSKLEDMPDDHIDYSDIPELSDEWFQNASKGSEIHIKVPISLRIDEDILSFFKLTGKRYQTRINAVLRAYMEAQKKAHG